VDVYLLLINESKKINFMQSKFITWQRMAKAMAIVFLMAGIITSCAKKDIQNEAQPAEVNNEQAASNAARALEQSAPATAEQEASAAGFSEQAMSEEAATTANGPKKNIVEIAVSKPRLSSLVAAVLKTGLAGALSNASANLTVFAPTNDAFAGLPAPFNNAANIGAITDPAQIAFLKNVLLYHVLGAEVFSHQISNGPSSAVTIKPAGSANDNTVYLSKTFGFIRVNGNSDVIRANINASNGVIHVINKVLLFPTQTIAAIAIPNPDLSALVAALVKTNLAGVFAGSGDFTVFAPTNAAFAQLPAPFKTAASISAITDPATIAALANILKYHVVGSRNFAWDLGIFRRITTIASAPNNKITTILGYNNGWVKGDNNTSYAQITPADILATNGVVHVINKVLLPK
jgi:uncharacterized surface protein with fasciclin (FAS1) repeats